jgi:hypothetical protein
MIKKLTPEMQIKRTLRSYLSPVRMTMIKKTANAGEDVGELESFHTVGGI